MKAIEAFSRQSHGGRAIVASLALGTLLSFGLASRASERAEAASLRVEATSTTLDWNAVAQAAGRIFVSGPRWTGFPGPSVALLEPGNRLRPFPDRAWSDWKPGKRAMPPCSGWPPRGHGAGRPTNRDRRQNPA